MPEPDESSFVEVLMQHIMDQVKIPKVQIERVVGPILGMFIAEALSEVLNDRFEMICAEFPLRKAQVTDPETNQSTNIDWLLYSIEHDQLVFLELKTTDTTFDQEQADIYLAAIKKIREHGSGFLIKDIEGICLASREHGKYKEVLTRIGHNERYAMCRDARLVYLAPKVMGDARRDTLDRDAVEWLCFQDLPETLSSRFVQEWRVIREHLVRLDSITRRSRCGEQEIDGHRNFADTCRFEKLIRLCEEKQDAIIVGFAGGAKRLDATSLNEIKSRSSYKWDHAENGSGVKDGRNWITGRQFLETVERLSRIPQPDAIGECRPTDLE